MWLLLDSENMLVCDTYIVSVDEVTHFIVEGMIVSVYVEQHL